MASRWISTVRSRGTLRVHNQAGAWRSQVNSALATFNRFELQVSLESTTNESEADIVVLLSGNNASYTFRRRGYGEVPLRTTFDSTIAHGKTVTAADTRTREILMAAIFLPQRLASANRGIREVVIVHEFFHAAGLNSDGDHDTQAGVFYSPMEVTHGHLRPWGTSEPAMPPITVGSRTTTALNELWRRP